MKEFKQLYKTEPDRMDALMTKIITDRLEELNFEAIVEEIDIYQEYKAKYQQLASECVNPDAGREKLEEYQETLDYIQFIRENAAYMQGLKDGLGLSAFAAGSSQIKLYGSDVYKLFGPESSGKAKGDGICERKAI